MNRDLDGCYFRVERNGEKCSVCFSDLTLAERDRIAEREGENAEFWRRLAYHLADCLIEIGDLMDRRME